MSHAFGDLLRQYRARKHGLSHARLAALAGYDPSLVGKMAQGRKELTGPSGRERVVRIIGVLHEEHVLATLEEANALLAAARMPPLYAGQPDEAVLIQELHIGHSPATAHPAQDISPIHHNLPAQLTRFIGREREVAELGRLVGAHRLVTLTGSGGVGKTRLAIEVGASFVGLRFALAGAPAPVAAAPLAHHAVAHERAANGATASVVLTFPDGIWLVELAPLVDPAAVARTVATVFHLPDELHRTPAEAVADYLHAKHVLLILDNCEHLIEACATLTEALLRACPHLHILATSREALHVPGEQAWRVPPLDMPDPAHLPPLDQVAGFDAVQLFVEHAALAQPGFSLTPDNMAVIARICHRLDGIPLAIEMAAARVPTLSVGEIAARLDQRFQLLTSGSRTALPRHQTLRAVLDWSYDLLSPSEQTLLARLSVFASGWTAELAEVVAADESMKAGEDKQPAASDRRGPHLALLATDILPLLLQLAEKSLVVADAEARGRVTRYRLLESVREYAAETLRVGELGDTDRRHERLAAYIMSRLTPDAGPSRRSRSEEMFARMGRLEAEPDNLRALMAWALARDDRGVTALTLAAALADSWASAQGHMAETQGWVEEALARGHAAPAALRVKAVNGLLRMLGARGYNLARWAALAEESLALSASIDDPYEQYESLAYAYNVHLGLWIKLALWTQPALWNANPHLPRMEALAGEMLALARRLEYPHGIVVGLEFCGHVRCFWGDYPAALRYYEASLQLALETSNQVMVFEVILNTARVGSSRALATCEQEAARQRELGERESLVLILRCLSDFVAAGGDFARAQSLLQEGLALRQKLGVPWSQDGGIAGLHFSLGRMSWLQGNYAEALDQFQRSLDIFQKAGAVRMVAHVHFFTGLALLALGDTVRASSHLRQSLSLYRELDGVEHIPYTLAALAMLAQAQGQPLRAARLAGAALMLRDRSPKWLWFELSSHWVQERLVAAISGLRDDPATAAAWIEGQQMSPDEAVAYALRGSQAEAESDSASVQ